MSFQQTLTTTQIVRGREDFPSERLCAVLVESPGRQSPIQAEQTLRLPLLAKKDREWEDMRPSFLEKIGGVKTARLEEESILLARALLTDRSVKFEDSDRLLRLVKKNKVLLRASHLFHFPDAAVAEAKHDVDEAFDLYNRVSDALTEGKVPFVLIKSFDSLPDIGHDVDLLVPDRSDFLQAESILLNKCDVRPSGLTHCDKLVGKFSCFLPGYKLDFEIYPTISQLGEVHLDPFTVLKDRKKTELNGREVWLTSVSNRTLIRIIHAVYRHKSFKLSDILDFLKLLQSCDDSELLEKIENARIGEAFVFYLASIDRFLEASTVEEHLRFRRLKRAAEARFGNDRLRFFGKDRLVLPYRIATPAIITLYLIKAAREASAGRWKSSLKCLAAPPLLVLEYLLTALRSGARGGIW